MHDHRFSDLTGQRDFMRFWVARLFGTAGNQMLMVAIGWQMYDLTGSAWDLGLVGLYQFVPALLFTLVAGHVADRWHRGRIVAFCMVAQALVAAVLVLSTIGFGAQAPWVSRTLLLAVSVVLGLARAFQMPAHGRVPHADTAAGTPARNQWQMPAHRRHTRPAHRRRTAGPPAPGRR